VELVGYTCLQSSNIDSTGGMLDPNREGKLWTIKTMADEPKTERRDKLMSNFKMMLQLFADEKKEEQDYEEEPETEEVEETEEAEGGEGDNQEHLLPQDKVDEVVKKRLKREHKKWQKELEKQFGTADLGEAKQYYEAGRAVTSASGKKPQEVLQRLKQQGATQNNSNNGYEANEDIKQEINALKQMVQSQQEQEIKEKESNEAKKEFGQLYDKYEDEIEEFAEEKDMSLVDAAAVVLRPHLKEHIEEQTINRQKKKRKKKVDATDDSPGSSSSSGALVDKLTSRQKRTAQKMGISPEKYAKRLQESGELE